MHEDAGWSVLREVLEGTCHGTRILASHYPYAGDATGVERHHAHRPVDTGIPLLHGHTHDREDGPHGSHEFHVGVDAFSFAPVQFELIDAWLEDLRREEGGTAAIVRERTGSGGSTSLDELARSIGVDLGEDSRWRAVLASVSAPSATLDQTEGCRHAAKGYRIAPAARDGAREQRLRDARNQCVMERPICATLSPTGARR